jgi:hypothetical protein
MGGNGASANETHASPPADLLVDDAQFGQRERAADSN